jgi:hypothetical protein
MRALRRFLILAVIAGVIAVVVRRRAAGQPADHGATARAPDWPPFDPPRRAVTVEPTDPPAATTWVAPVDGACPTGYPVKANDNSGIFHVPGGRSYERTVAERCYATPAAAEADGYRQAKA